jgi:hypothetical protein
MCGVDWNALGTWVQAVGTIGAFGVALYLLIQANQDRRIAQARSVWIENHGAHGQLADPQSRELSGAMVSYTLHNQSTEPIFELAVGVVGHDPIAPPLPMLMPNDRSQAAESAVGPVDPRARERAGSDLLDVHRRRGPGVAADVDGDAQAGVNEEAQRVMRWPVQDAASRGYGEPRDRLLGAVYTAVLAMRPGGALEPSILMPIERPAGTKSTNVKAPPTIRPAEL